MSKEIKEKNRLSTANIVGIVLMAVFLPIIIFNMILVIQGAVNKDKVPSLFNISPLIVDSDSMAKGYCADPINYPDYKGAFNKHDLIFIKKVDTEKLEKGDIITYIDHNKKVVTHRIVDKQIASDGVIEYTLKGDNVMSADSEAVTPDIIAGKYAGRVPFVGWIVMQIQQPVGIMLLVLLPVAVFFGVVLIQKQREAKIDASKTEALVAEIERLKNENSKLENNDDTKENSEE